MKVDREVNLDPRNLIDRFPGEQRIFLKKESYTSGQTDTLTVEEEKEEEEESGLLCMNCSNEITHSSHGVERSGAFRHLFINPAGLPFRIGCFSRAPGCTLHGLPTSEFTWFPGYRWQVALCDSCMIHLGWFYTGKDEFFGLIMARLKEK